MSRQGKVRSGEGDCWLVEQGEGELEEKEVVEGLGKDEVRGRNMK